MSLIKAGENTLIDLDKVSHVDFYPDGSLAGARKVLEDELWIYFDSQHFPLYGDRAREVWNSISNSVPKLSNEIKESEPTLTGRIYRGHKISITSFISSDQTHYSVSTITPDGQVLQAGGEMLSMALIRIQAAIDEWLSAHMVTPK